MSERLGFVSTRFAGADGVSLESAKWAEVFWEQKHTSYWYGGRLYRAPQMSMCVPEAYFAHPENALINQQIWGTRTRSAYITARIHALAKYLKQTLHEFVDEFGISILIVENALSIPMHVPLGIAIVEFLSETQIPAIAHHHDFYWERTRFSVNAVSDYLEMAFPPRERDVQHVVINQGAQEELSWRKGVPSVLIPNVFDFDKPPQEPDEYAQDVRAEIGLSEDDVMILQPTRVVPRKGIEHAIKLVQTLNNPRYKLVISHEAGDEGYEYLEMLEDLARESGVDARFISTRVGDIRYRNADGAKVYTLWDLYYHADLVTYPSLYEGFGNAFLEAVYFRLPLVINRYAIFARDIEPLGFRFIVMNGFVTRKIVEETRKILEESEYREAIIDHNYQVAARHYSYANLRRQIRALMDNVKAW